MNYWKHALLSKHKFTGAAQDYLQIHKFLDSSKLFCFNIRHRILLHNTYGIDLCTQRFGELLTNSDNKNVLVRDIAAEHCKEDLMGFVPTLNHWFKDVDNQVLEHFRPINPSDARLKEFVLQPFLMSGLKTSLIITHSNFGVHLAKEMLGIDYAMELSHYISETGIHKLLGYVKFSERWQYTPDLNQLETIQHEL
ncbi:hypothetical protein CLV59_11013 [Chitinophaga dinghuensis]|uniref:DUF6915 domain-containing protein n=1 Tax=Chitinophaga dinghuensis TaxID=1539050 RepID=A0A327VNH6_9BACT|nr:hypothetical protein [Chitinophaga dinghuensis]RAJ74967.1 hypothetical protein CLV59_11013 [Chitinophaga dinghuensis]